MEVDMTQGRPLDTMLPFMVNCLIGGIVLTLYSICDLIIVGNFSDTNAVAAIGLTTPINFMFIGFINGITSGFSINIAASFGEKKIDKLKRYIAMSFYIGAIVSLILTVLLVKYNPVFLRLLNTPENIFNDANIYITIQYYGTIVIVLLNSIVGILRGIGDSKTPLYLMVSTSIFNIILDLILVGLFKLGVYGASIATVVSMFIAFVVIYIYAIKKYDIFKLSLDDFRPKARLLIDHIKQGVPMGIQFSITALGTLMVQSMLNRYGSNYIAGFTAANKIQQIGIQIYIAFSVALTTFIGQNRGARRYDRIYEGTKKIFIINLIVSVVLMILTLILSTPLIRLFNMGADYEMIRAGNIYFYTAIWFYPFLSAIFVFRNGLQGLGYSSLSLVSGITELIARIFAVVILGKYWGYVGICFSDSTAWVLAGVIIMIIYYYILKKEMKKDELNSLCERDIL